MPIRRIFSGSLHNVQSFGRRIDREVQLFKETARIKKWEVFKIESLILLAEFQKIYS